MGFKKTLILIMIMFCNFAAATEEAGGPAVGAGRGVFRVGAGFSEGEYTKLMAAMRAGDLDASSGQTIFSILAVEDSLTAGVLSSLPGNLEVTLVWGLMKNRSVAGFGFPVLVEIPRAPAAMSGPFPQTIYRFINDPARSNFYQVGEQISGVYRCDVNVCETEEGCVDKDIALIGNKDVDVLENNFLFPEDDNHKVTRDPSGRFNHSVLHISIKHDPTKPPYKGWSVRFFLKNARGEELHATSELAGRALVVGSPIADAPESGDHGGAPLVQKPLSREELLAKSRAAREAARAKAGRGKK